jgi:hypothetical protein
MMEPVKVETILTTLEEVYLYAFCVLQAPFPAGEAAIAKDAYYSYHYALYILEAPFPAGEAVIAKDAHYSYLYALYVLKHPKPDNWAKEFKAKESEGE